MIASAVILFLIEATIVVEKTKAVIFALSVLVVGLAARQFARRQAATVTAAAPAMVKIPEAVSVAGATRPESIAFESKMMVSVRGGGEKLLRQACEEAKLRKAFLFVLHIKQIAVTGLLPDKVPAESFVNQEWMETICKQYGIPFRIISILSSEVGYTIAEQVATFGIDRLVLGATQRTLVEKALRGDIIRTVSELLPEEIQLIIYRA